MEFNQPLDAADQFASGNVPVCLQQAVHFCGGAVAGLIEVRLYA